MKADHVRLIPAAALLLFAVTACDSSKPAPAGDTAAPPAADTAKLGGGTKHDPPIEPEQVPDGHWYCDMGTVEYSRPAKGDGKCPICKMNLKQKGAGHEGHAH